MAGRFRILLTRPWPSAAEARLAERYDVDIHDAAPLDQAGLAEALRGYDALCPTITDRIDRALLNETGPLRARALCNFGAGVDHIDLDACRDAGLIVTNTPGVLTDDTADIAMLLMLTCLRRGGEGERLVRAGAWPGWAPTHMLGRRMTGKVLGIVGFGRIGQAVAQRAHHGFGMEVIYHGRSRASAAIEAACGARLAPLEELLATANVVSLHCPSTAETENMIDAGALAKMKPDAVLVNTARGNLIDEAALVAALQTGGIAAAGLDVYRGEPNVRAEFLDLPNVVLLPHLGSATLETRTAMGMCAADNLDAVLAGAEPPNRLV
jgi:lactate dehydrogenase-like 2-hydroxyacid dehydrogenase